jgi:hypothetical protein
MDVPPIVKLLEKAERWRDLLDSGKVRNRAVLARNEGTSTNRVAQVLRLLNLPAELITTLRRLRPGTPPRMATERELRRATGAAHLEEIKRRCLVWMV